jgi:hypothetical protein
MLFELDLLFFEKDRLNSTEYLKKSGLLEQSILDGMQRLRIVLDIIPYSSNNWSVERINHKKRSNSGDEKKYPTLIKIERMTFRLLRHFFVAGAFYTALLEKLHKGKTTPNSIKNKLEDGTFKKEYYNRWKLWCHARRFPKLGEDVELDSLGSFKEESLRKTILEIMKKGCNEKRINTMWDTRRRNKN